MTDASIDEVADELKWRDDSWRDGVSRLADNVTEALDAVHAVGVVARQLRMLAANASIEAARVPGAVALAEIARRMRALSEETSQLHTTLTNTLQVHGHALSELQGTLQQSSLSRSSSVVPPVPGAELGGAVNAPHSV